MVNLATIAWLLGGLGSFTSAAVALIVDRPFQRPLLALAVAIATFFVCGVPMAV